MVFFNIKSMIRLFIKACTVFAFLLLIVLCFFLIFSNSNIVSAVTVADYNNDITYDLPDFPTSNFNENYLVIWKDGNNLNLITGTGTGIDNISALHLVWEGGNKFMGWSGKQTYWASGVTTYVYSSTMNSSSWTLTNTYTDTTFAPSQFYDPQKLIYTSVTVYRRNVGNIYFPEDFAIQTLTAPVIENFQFPNVVTSMEHGEYFDIIINSNDFYDYPIYFYMNNGSLDIDSSEKAIAFILDENSPYLLHHTGDVLAWQIPKKDLIPIYNNCVYNFSLSYGENGALSTGVQTLTTNFSALGLEMANVDTQDATQQTADELKEMNDFLKDDSFDNNSIINDMPSSDEYTDPSDGGLLTIFNSLEDAFTDDSNTPVRFYIPFTDNKYIDLPPDLTSSHVPQVILTIIQGLYWYIICRYIIKDISKTANKAKSGELLDSKDGNIRTELL